LRLGIYKDSRTRARDAYGGLLFDLSATVYPAVLDVTSQFEVYSLATAAYFTFPVIKRPFVSLKAGAKQVRGDFPYQEAAFIGGEPSERKLPFQRYAGDAAIYGSAELRIPVVDFPLYCPSISGCTLRKRRSRIRGPSVARRMAQLEGRRGLDWHSEPLQRRRCRSGELCGPQYRSGENRILVLDVGRE
jgi:hypothetical protein